MEKKKYFDLFEELVKERLELKAGKIYLDLQLYELLKKYCWLFDRISEELETEIKEVELEEKSDSIVISMMCLDFEIMSHMHPIYQVIPNTLFISFSNYENRLVKTSFVFPSIYKRSK